MISQNPKHSEKDFIAEVDPITREKIGLIRNWTRTQPISWQLVSPYGLDQLPTNWSRPSPVSNTNCELNEEKIGIFLVQIKQVSLSHSITIILF